jgi:hypothetical protein
MDFFFQLKICWQVQLAMQAFAKFKNQKTKTGQQEVHLSSGCAHVHMTKIPCKFLELVIGSMNR